MNAVDLEDVIELPTLLALVMDAPRLRVEVMFVRDGCLSVTLIVLFVIAAAVEVPAHVPAPSATIRTLLVTVDVPADVPTLVAVDRATPDIEAIPADDPAASAVDMAVPETLAIPADDPTLLRS